jgi:hypothetical protein
LVSSFLLLAKQYINQVEKQKMNPKWEWDLKTRPKGGSKEDGYTSPFGKKAKFLNQNKNQTAQNETHH